MHQNGADRARVPTLRMPNEAASTAGFASTGAAGKVKWNVTPRPSPPRPKSGRLAIRRFDFADCRAHAAALRLRRKECVEYPVGLAQGQPGACVTYRDLDLAVLAQLRPEEYPDSVWAVPFDPCSARLYASKSQFA